MKLDSTYLITEIIKALEGQQEALFSKGHTFWHCDAIDTNNKGVYKPFRYYQTNRSIGMSTCSTCQELMEIRKNIRKWQKLANLPLTPLFTNITDNKPLKRMHVSDNRICNPNYDYCMSGRT